MDDSVLAAVYSLALPLAVVAAIVAATLPFLPRWSGWAELARRHPQPLPGPPRTRVMAPVQMGDRVFAFRYRVVRGWVDEAGIHLAHPWPMRLTHEAIRIPWEAVGEAAHRRRAMIDEVVVTVRGLGWPLVFRGTFGAMVMRVHAERAGTTEMAE